MVFTRLLIEDIWGLNYLPPISEQTDEELKEQAAQTYNNLPGDQILLQTDQVILAAFGQIKVMGTLDKSIQLLAILSLERMERMYRLLWNWNKTEPLYNIAIMGHDLIRFIKVQSHK